MKSIFISTIFVITLFNCQGMAAEIRHIDIPGTGDSQSLLRSLAVLFEQRNESIKVTIPESIGSGGGIDAVANGRALVGRTARPLSQEERNLGLIEYSFARVPIVLVVHPTVTGFDNLTDRQVVDIFSGKITNWLTLGGPDHKIYVVNREKGDVTRDVLSAHLPDFDKIIPTGIIFYSNPDALSAITNNAYTISYLSLSSALSNKLRIVEIDGLNPLDPGSGYPYVTRFFLISKGAIGGDAKRFLDFLVSDEARKEMKDQGVIPVH